MARMGSFRERVDVDSAPPLPRPFRLPTGSRKSFSISPYGPPGKPKFKPFKFSPYQRPEWHTPPHRNSAQKSIQAHNPNTYIKVTSKVLPKKGAKGPAKYVWVNGKPMLDKKGNAINKAGLYRPVTVTIKTPYGSTTTATRYVLIPSFPKTASSAANLERDQLRWLWRYDRKLYWTRWKDYYQPRREEILRDSREDYLAARRRAKTQYEREKEKALAKWREAKAKYDKWDERLRAQFD